MADKDEKVKKVTVEAIKWHTNGGESYDVGDTYEVDEDAAASLAINGFAIRTDREAVAKKAAKDAKDAEKDTKGKK